MEPAGTAVPVRPRVLIVDDDPHCLRLLNSLLEGVAQVFFATSGEEALRQIARHRPDLVLLDAEMPGLGGYGTCAALQANPETADLPVIFVTAHTDPVSETRALSLGAVDFIHKPVNPSVVMARVRTQLVLKQKTDELRRLTTLDALTGIANRRAFDDGLHREWRRAVRHSEPLSLLMLDIDYFKRYNDTHGHPAGDACLRQVARTLADSARRAGDLVARYGGEEFAIVLPHTPAANARVFAERLCAGVRALAMAHSDSPLERVTVSIGVASLCPRCSADACPATSFLPCFPADRCHTGPEMLLALADQALYTAKRNGRDRVASLSDPFGFVPAGECIGA